MAKKLCPNCKKEISDKDKKCPSCGKKIDVEIKREQVKKKKKKKENKKIEKPEIKKVIKEEKQEVVVKEKPIVKEELNNEIKTINYENAKEDIDNEKDQDLEKTISIINVETAAKEGYREYAEQLASSMKKKKENSKLVFIIIIAILTVIIIFLSILLLQKHENSQIDNSEPASSTIRKPTIEMNIYYSNGKFLTEKTSRSIVLGSIKTVEENIELFDGILLYNDYGNYDGAIVLYKDDGLIKTYNTKTLEEKIINLSSKYNRYKLVYEPKKNDYIGISYLEDADVRTNRYGTETVMSFKSSGYYDSESGKVLYENDGYYNYQYVSSTKVKAYKGIDTKKLVLLDAKTEKEYVSKEIDDTLCGTIDFQILNDNYIISGKPNCVDNKLTNITIYNKDMLEIVDNIKYYSDIHFYNGQLYTTKDNIVYKFDSNGRLKYESKEYTRVLDIINNYFVVIDNNEIKLSNENDTKYTLDKWQEGYVYDLNSSGYFDESKLETNSEYGEGIYISILKDELGTEVARYYFNISTKEVIKIK